ncbi:hypothetical protein JHW43_007578 [Diplocarpon mali]|nr:hypothetical protein JHW43_007578 [Diplocarpon mali]
MRVSGLNLVVYFVGASNASTTGAPEWQQASTRSFIYIVLDGFGTGSQTLARNLASLVPGSFDSVAIGVFDDRQPAPSILEAAKLESFKTGFIATSRITHATPGCTLPIYTYECYFKPVNQFGSCRTDGIDLLALSKEQDFSVPTDFAGFNKLNGPLHPDPKKLFKKVIPLGQMSYEIYRALNLEHSLGDDQNSARTLGKCHQNSTRGYFIMIKASRIDHIGPNDDSVGHLHDIIQYNEVMEYVHT